MNGKQRRKILAVAMTMALLVASGAATAESNNMEELGKLGGWPSLDALVKQALRGEAPQEVIVEELDGGLVKIVIPMRENSPILRQKQARDLINCAIYVGLSEPNFSAGILSFDAAPLAQIQYRAGWLVYNTSNVAVEADSILKTKGPGQDLKIDDTLSYAPQAFTLFFGTWVPGWDDGFHSIEAKVKGAKPTKIKANFCAGCPF